MTPLGNSQPEVLERPDRPDRGNIIIGKQSRERLLTGKQLLREGITQLRGGIVAMELNGKFRPDRNAEFFRHFADRVPTNP